MANVNYETLRQPSFSTFGGRGSLFSSLRRAALGAFGILLVWQQRLAERQQLASMSEFHLKDIGISRADAELEAAKPFWTA